MSEVKEPLIQRCYDVHLEAREDEGKGIIKGRPIVYNSRTNLGCFDEIILPGALERADLNDVRLCLNHDTSYVYARSRRNNPNSTMRLMLSAEGLDFEASLAIKDSPKARDYYSAVTREDIDKMSFMFSIEKDEWEGLDTDHPLRKIISISSVVEVSAVTFPAYDATEIYARSKETLDNVRSALESARQHSGRSLDSDELELEKLKTQILGGN